MTPKAKPLTLSEPVHILSLGAGVQSSTMALMALPFPTHRVTAGDLGVDVLRQRITAGAAKVSEPTFNSRLSEP
jgi:hypothetical protein